MDDLVKPLSQWGVRELARATGISPTTATRVKRGEGDFDGDTLRAVLAATGHCMCCQRKDSTEAALQYLSDTGQMMDRIEALEAKVAAADALADAGGQIRQRCGPLAPDGKKWDTALAAYRGAGK